MATRSIHMTERRHILSPTIVPSLSCAFRTSNCSQKLISLHRESLDTRFCQYLRNSVSFVDFEEPPGRVLDLGCGVSCDTHSSVHFTWPLLSQSGSWVIDAAKEWPECKLVWSNYISNDPFLIEGSLGWIWLGRCPATFENIGPIDRLSNRVEARKFVCFFITTSPTTSLNIQTSLTTQLPFDDDEFDHVHVHAIARAVPENKVFSWKIFPSQIINIASHLVGTHIWSKASLHLPLLTQSTQEICRVLRPGGTVEVVEDGDWVLLFTWPLGNNLLQI